MSKITPSDVKPTNEPSHTPTAPKFKIKPNKYPDGMPSNQYAPKLRNNGILTSVNPLRIPIPVACNPSEIWNMAAMINKFDATAITSLSSIYIEGINFLNSIRMIPEQNIIDVESAIAENPDLLTFTKFFSPKAVPTRTVPAKEIPKITIYDIEAKLRAI